MCVRWGIDNYTRHFVPFPISTFALCSVHRTSVIKRPTVDYCVILKNQKTLRAPQTDPCTKKCAGKVSHNLAGIPPTGLVRATGTPT